jgi:hypothetical protein
MGGTKEVEMPGDGEGKLLGAALSGSLRLGPAGVGEAGCVELNRCLGRQGTGAVWGGSFQDARTGWAVAGGLVFGGARNKRD